MADLTRAWDEWLADLSDALGIGVYTMMFISAIVALLVGLGWLFWPAWLPWRWNWSARGRGARRARGRQRDGRRRRLGRLRRRLRWRLRRRRRRSGDEDEELEQLADDEVPDLPAEVLAQTADELAAAGRYAEAVRERLRAILRGLIERELLPSGPGWTVMELAAAGARARPALGGPLRAAAGVFSEIWYGCRPATPEDDAAMRGYASAVSQAAGAAASAVGA